MRIVWVLLLVACDHSPSKLDVPAATATAAATSDNVPWPTPTDQATPSADTISGTVVETMGAATYTYARLDHDGEQLWLAGPETKLVVGVKLGPLSGTIMTNFHSDSLNRTFPKIYFVNTFGQPVPASHSTTAAGHTDVGASATLDGSVVETMDAGGYTYALVDHAGVKTWLAGPTTKLAVGAKLAGMTGTSMSHFRSGTLNRTFDQIYFVNAYRY